MSEITVRYGRTDGPTLDIEKHNLVTIWCLDNLPPFEQRFLDGFSNSINKILFITISEEIVETLRK